ncbi:hypothetical protein RHGRI_004435 [Rhododendron griersonianum]|uniref:Gnk2-homologous domain-containing protein n=1 Tax=Rhododendron griersonianum TaxID=479676 RepID=A0AAV6LAZ6_9ERIC|nr:hypothetical protein RHGRI_004435 [Rhododendron griersonianum]
MCINTANFTINSAYGENRKEILSSLASNVEAFGGFYTGHIGEGSERVYALGLCRRDLHDEDCFSCVNSSSQAIIEKCPYQKEATNFGPPSLCIVRYSDKNFSRITDSSPAQLIYNLSKITNNTDEFDQALNSLVDSLIDTADNGPPRSMFATGAKKFSEYDSIYALMECIRGQTPDDCSMVCPLSLNLLMPHRHPLYPLILLLHPQQQT